eukprot:CAMPEP_0172509458 /NCGR_PEP_ID=MMETSP1066-20121228/220442_1 /TAXON_ID=671091 /ORGANISM="Coscinodiscus wailesii, Strain CCMP2513" /LENGTH=47 /DNA_ID= /DNA_START= /DNA_END= /DNA_ORIENTATION=
MKFEDDAPDDNDDNDDDDDALSLFLAVSDIAGTFSDENCSLHITRLI